MKRFHVHVQVADLAQSISFYSKLFGAEPTRQEPDYAKWMLEDPRLNFAISARGGAIGIDHLGLQTDDPTELTTMRERAREADMALLNEGETTCCYARSDKYWLTDPQGLAWEQFHTLDTIPTFSAPTPQSTEAACCGPAPATQALTGTERAPRGKPIGIAVRPTANSDACC